MKVVGDYYSASFSLDTAEALFLAIPVTQRDDYFAAYELSGDEVRTVYTLESQYKYYVFYADLFLYLEYLGPSQGYDRILFYSPPLAVGDLLSSSWDQLLAGDDEIQGSRNKDTILGYAGNDVLYGGGSDDLLNGGDGLDTAVYNGLRSNYEIEFVATQVLVTDLSGNEGSDTLFSIEFLQFANEVLTVDTLRVIDGYVAGARVYVDANHSNTADSTEYIGTTDANGSFSFATSLKGNIIATGGINTDTGLENYLTLYAPKGAKVVTPITSLLTYYMDASGLVAAEAVQDLLEAFVLPSDIDLLTFDPLDPSNTGAYALAVQKLNVQLAVLFTVESSIVELLSGLIPQTEHIDLTAPALLESLIDIGSVGWISARLSEIGSSKTLEEITELQLSVINNLKTSAIASSIVWENQEGDEVIVGSTAYDIFVSPGLYRDFSIEKSDGFYLLKDAQERLGSDQLMDIDRLIFDDLSVVFDLVGSDSAGGVYRLYQAAFNRVPDYEGLGYWVSVLNGGESLLNISRSFIESAEFELRYGSEIGDSSFVTLLYQNVLGRAPDVAGFDYWLKELESGLGRDGVLSSFSESDENQINVIGQIENGIPFTPFDQG